MIKRAKRFKTAGIEVRRKIREGGHWLGLLTQRGLELKLCFALQASGTEGCANPYRDVGIEPTFLPFHSPFLHSTLFLSSIFLFLSVANLDISVPSFRQRDQVRHCIHTRKIYKNE